MESRGRRSKRRRSSSSSCCEGGARRPVAVAPWSRGAAAAAQQGQAVGELALVCVRHELQASKVLDVDVDGTEVVGNNPLEEGANDAARNDGSGPGARKLSIPQGSRLYSHVADPSPSFRSGNLQDDLSHIGDSCRQGLQLLDQVNIFFKQVRRDSILATERLTRDGVLVRLEEARRSLDESEARREEAERLRAEAEVGRAAAEEQLIKERAAAEEQLLKERAAWKESDKKRESMLTMAYKMLGSGLQKSKGASSHTSRPPK